MSITKTREFFSLPNVHYADFLFICVDLYLSATLLLVQYLHQYQSYEYVGSPQIHAFQN